MVIFIVIQFVQVRKDNPPIQNPFSGPSEITNILRHSCYDCHSNETVWPWYSSIAPASWLVAHDVHEAREKLNFSSWGSLDNFEQQHAKKEILEEVLDGEMPPLLYKLTHLGTALSETEKNTIKDWSETKKEIKLDSKRKKKKSKKSIKSSKN